MKLAVCVQIVVCLVLIVNANRGVLEKLLEKVEIQHQPLSETTITNNIVKSNYDHAIIL